MWSPSSLQTALDTARTDLLAQRNDEGHWVGELSSSALSTATAISALSIVIREEPEQQEELQPLVDRGIAWLLAHRNDDGGWGDTDKSWSNISTTWLVSAALHLADVSQQHADLLTEAQRYIEQQGGIAGLRKRYGKDKTFVVPILANCALAGLVSWREVASLPFELACVPHTLLGILRLPVVSYAIPALVAIGQAKFFFHKPWNPVVRLIRRMAIGRSLKALHRMQPASGGYLEATPLTSFVVMSLASIGLATHPVVRQGVQFLQASMREDGSWPIDTDLAAWNTSLALQALAAAGDDIDDKPAIDWLLSCQHHDVHPFTNAAPGGWGWTDLSGAVPDADDTPGAMLVLATAIRSVGPTEQERITSAAQAGIAWLLGLQNRDGGWPTFCRGWGALPFDRSGADLTAHALRALHAWKQAAADWPDRLATPHIEKAIRCGLKYLAKKQALDGSWLPLWFGNQHNPGEENPVYGTAKVLMAYRDLGLLGSKPAQKGLHWLVANQHDNGGWGTVPNKKSGKKVEIASVEETALAVEILASASSTADTKHSPAPVSSNCSWPREKQLESTRKGPNEPTYRAAFDRGLAWLILAVGEGAHLESSPIGFYFAKLWYYERLYPMSFTVSALGHAAQRYIAPSEDDLPCE